MKVAVCDDNAEYIKSIVENLNGLNDPNIECDTYCGSEELLAAYKSKGTYDLVFLDVEMGGINGIETGERIRNIDNHAVIVFVTSYMTYASKCYSSSPLWFLLKPIDGAEFEKMFSAVRKKLARQSKVIAFTYDKTHVRLFCEDIIYCESQDHNTWIYTKDERYRIGKKLSDLSSALDTDTMFRVHKSFVVNFSFIKTISGNEIKLYHCDRTIPISRTYKKEVTENYTKFIERDFCI